MSILFVIHSSNVWLNVRKCVLLLHMNTTICKRMHLQTAQIQNDRAREITARTKCICYSKCNNRCCREASNSFVCVKSFRVPVLLAFFHLLWSIQSFESEIKEKSVTGLRLTKKKPYETHEQFNLFEQSFFWLSLSSSSSLCSAERLWSVV